MELTSEINKVAEHFFGITELKTIQYQIISDLLEANDVLAILPTGSGKSLCYQIPALILPGTLVVVSPLIALMNEQVHNLQQLGIAAECLHSNLEPAQINLILQHLIQEKIQLLYLSPERLLQSGLIKRLQNIKLSAIAIDEAHCIVHWGGDFRPEYERLSRLKSYFPSIPILALTATATPMQQNTIIEHLQLQPKKHLNSAFKPNIHFKIIPQYREKSSLKALIKAHIGQSGIIYCASQKRVEFLYHHLKSSYPNIFYYHAGLTPEYRQNQQQQFYQHPDAIMIATVAFGMGINKNDIRFIIHFDIPGRMDQFIQESGRAGRDQKAAYHYLNYDPKHYLQLNLWRILKAKPEDRQALLQELRMMSQFLMAKTCFQQQIFTYFEHKDIEACGTCQPCQHLKAEEPNFIDAIKLMSCIHRLGKEAELHLCISVLIGTSKIYQMLSTFGIGQHQPTGYWYHLFNELFSKNWINLNLAPAPYWQLSLEGVTVMRQYKEKFIVDTLV